MIPEALDAFVAVAATSVALTLGGSYAGISNDVIEEPCNSLPEFYETKKYLASGLTPI